MIRVAQLAISDGQIKALEVCRSAIDFWDRHGNLDQTRISSNVVSLIDDAVRNELAPFVERGKGRGIWKRKGTAIWKATTLDRFSEAIEDFIHRKQSGGDYVPGQRTLTLPMPEGKLTIYNRMALVWPQGFLEMSSSLYPTDTSTLPTIHLICNFYTKQRQGRGLGKIDRSIDA